MTQDRDREYAAAGLGRQPELVGHRWLRQFLERLGPGDRRICEPASESQVDEFVDGHERGKAAARRRCEQRVGDDRTIGSTTRPTDRRLGQLLPCLEVTRGADRDLGLRPLALRWDLLGDLERRRAVGGLDRDRPLAGMGIGLHPLDRVADRAVLLDHEIERARCTREPVDPVALDREHCLRAAHLAQQRRIGAG